MEKNYLDSKPVVYFHFQCFLAENKTSEMIKKMDKRLKMFAETALRHLESIDGLAINSDETPSEQVRFILLQHRKTRLQVLRNREKRKALVDGIQSLLNQSDANVRRLEEIEKRLSGEIL